MRPEKLEIMKKIDSLVASGLSVVEAADQLGIPKKEIYNMRTHRAATERKKMGIAPTPKVKAYKKITHEKIHLQTMLPEVPAPPAEFELKGSPEAIARFLKAMK